MINFAAKINKIIGPNKRQPDFLRTSTKGTELVGYFCVIAEGLELSWAAGLRKRLGIAGADDALRTYLIDLHRRLYISLLHKA